MSARFADVAFSRKLIDGTGRAGRASLIMVEAHSAGRARLSDNKENASSVAVLAKIAIAIRVDR